MSRATAAFADAMESCAGCVISCTIYFLSYLRKGGETHDCPFLFRMKGPSYEQGTRLQASAGLHHLMANHWHVLVSTYESIPERPLTHLVLQSETLEKQFEKPLRQNLDTYRTIVHVSFLETSSVTSPPVPVLFGLRHRSTGD